MFLSILTSRRCRSHLKLQTPFILLNDASERNISIMGKTCKSLGAVNAKENYRRSFDEDWWIALRESTGSAIQPTDFREITCCRETTGVAFCRSRKVPWISRRSLIMPLFTRCQPQPDTIERIMRIPYPSTEESPMCEMYASISDPHSNKNQ